MNHFEPGQFGKWLVAAGLTLAAIGILVILLSKLGLFRLPGDFQWQGRNWRVYFPLASSLILSAILTLVLWLVYYFRHR